MTGDASSSRGRPIDVPEAEWEAAVRREAVIRPLAVGRKPGAAEVAGAARKLGTSTRQVYRMVAAFRENPVTSSLVRLPPGRKRGARRLDPKAEEVTRAAIDRFYKSREKPSLKALYRYVQHDCRAAGLVPPSLKAVRARVGDRPLRELMRAREGAAAARDRLAPAVDGLRPSAPLELVQIDHTLVDLHLRDDLLRLPLGRPWLTLVLDVYSRCVLGLYVSLDPPSATSVALALTQAVLPKEMPPGAGSQLGWPMQGLMSSVHVDNAAEFHSKAMTRGCQEHGIRLAYRTPGTPQHGGHIERLMGTLMGRVQQFPGTAFSGVSERGDYPSEERAVLSLREFERILTLEVIGPYHNEIHSSLGRSPASVWAEWMLGGGSPCLPANRHNFVLDFLPFEYRVVGREGLRLFNIRYFDGALTSLIGTSSKLRVKYDPRDLSAVFAQMPGGRHLRVPYSDLARPPITLWEHREAVRRLRAEGRRSVDEHAIFAAVEEQRRTIADAYARSKAARRTASRVVEARRTPLPPEKATAEPNAGLPRPSSEESEARVPKPTDEDIEASEFWS